MPVPNETLRGELSVKPDDVNRSSLSPPLRRLVVWRCSARYPRPVHVPLKLRVLSALAWVTRRILLIKRSGLRLVLCDFEVGLYVLIKRHKKYLALNLCCTVQVCELGGFPFFFQIQLVNLHRKEPWLYS